MSRTLFLQARSLWNLMLCLVFLGCAAFPHSLAQNGPPESGIAGIVLKGPMCPGPARSDRPCPDKPVSGTFQVLGQDGNMAAAFQSDAQGRFKVSLAPGHYTVLPAGLPAGRNPLGDSAKVTVVSGDYVQVVLHWDTGMR